MTEIVDLSKRRQPVTYTVTITHHWDDTLEVFVADVADDERNRASVADALHRASQMFGPLAPAQPAPQGVVHEEQNTEQRKVFWNWLPLAYRDGHLGEEPKFTKYNMEVAHYAGWCAALTSTGVDDSLAADPAVKPTLAEALTVPEVKALVKALNQMVIHAEWREQNDGVFWDATKEARAALAAYRGEKP